MPVAQVAVNSRLHFPLSHRSSLLRRAACKGSQGSGAATSDAVYNAALFAVRPSGPQPEYQEDYLVKTIAEFRIPYQQVLDPEGRLVADLPEFAKDPEELLRCTA
jgi:hypothetical protein